MNKIQSWNCLLFTLYNTSSVAWWLRALGKFDGGMTVRSNPRFVDTGISKCVVLKVRLYLMYMCMYFVGQFQNRWFLKKSNILFFTFHIFDLIGNGGNRRRARGGILIFLRGWKNVIYHSKTHACLPGKLSLS